MSERHFKAHENMLLRRNRELCVITALMPLRYVPLRFAFFG